jgi:glycine/D-amino acid oxidase-like deaminating enzyme
LAQAAQRAGSRIFADSPAVKLTRAGADWRIDTPQSSVTSRVVILATDAYTGRIVDPLRRTIVAVPSFQVATAPIPDDLRRSILPEGQSASDTWHLLRYFRLDRTGRLIMGTRGYFADVPLQTAARPHYRAVAEIYPQLAGIAFDYHWGGMVGMTRDHLPHLHEIEPGLLAGLGYNGRGIAMATLMGRLLARRVLGESAMDLGFPITPMRPIPFHRFNRAGARAAIQILRALDGLAQLRERWSGRWRAA